MFKLILRKEVLLYLCISAVASVPVLVSAQALEEIVVTAQRRVQNLQEVPISIEAFTGAEMQKQGFRNLDDLANFSASVLVNDDGFLSVERTVRGFGTTGNALTLEQAVPIFMDGIHYGRASQVKTAFLDLERLEVLKGPQPVYFGMSATAGAFNIQSARPTPEWEGYLDTEYGLPAKGAIEGAIGGPINDAWGIRVAGKYEIADGFLKDVVSGADVGDYEQLGGRAIVEWNPNDAFTARFKVEGSAIEKFPEAAHVCHTAGPLIYGRNSASKVGDKDYYDEGNEKSVLGEVPIGEEWEVPVTIDDDCFGSNNGISSGGPYYRPPLGIREEQSTTGAIDAREAVDEWNKILWEETGGTAGSPYGARGIEKIDSITGYADLTWSFDNGLEVVSTTGYSGYKRLNVRDNSRSPFLLNMQDRVELFDQWSTELRVSSISGGTLEWTAGYFYQFTDYDITSNSTRPNTRRGLRFNHLLWEDQEWNSVFANVTLNFLDNRASIDLGGRFADLKKRGAISGKAGMWIFDEAPCKAGPDDDIGLGDTDPATCTIDPKGMQITKNDLNGGFLLPEADTDNLWVMGYKDSRSTPRNWRSPRAHAVGLILQVPYEDQAAGKFVANDRRGPYSPTTDRDGDGKGDGIFDSSEFDPQVTLRYRVNDDHSLFGRWAQTYKAGGFDTGTTTINKTVDEFVFKPETAETFEAGSKGNLWDSRARYDITFFRTTFNDFQITVPTGNPDDPFLNANAGQQRVQGTEFNFSIAATDDLTVSLAGALMQGEMTYFPAGGCTGTEAQNYTVSGCVLETAGDPDSGGTIDRSGEESPRSPDWKFVLSLDHSMPLPGGNYRVATNFKGYASDGYITDTNGFGKTVMMKQHSDMNLTVGIGDIEDTWMLQAFGRNILEARPTYTASEDLSPNGELSSTMSPNNFMSYGVKFRYNFR